MCGTSCDNPVKNLACQKSLIFSHLLWQHLQCVPWHPVCSHDWQFLDCSSWWHVRTLWHYDCLFWYCQHWSQHWALQLRMKRMQHWGVLQNFRKILRSCQVEMVHRSKCRNWVFSMIRTTQIFLMLKRRKPVWCNVPSLQIQMWFFSNICFRDLFRQTISTVWLKIARRHCTWRWIIHRR